MTANPYPLFPLVPDVVMVLDPDPSSALDGSGLVYSFFSGGSSNVGAYYDHFRVKAEQATTPGMARIFLYLLVGGVGTAVLWKEIPVSAVTPSGTVKSFEAEYVPTRPLPLGTSDFASSSYVAHENTENINFGAFGGDY